MASFEDDAGVTSPPTAQEPRSLSIREPPTLISAAFESGKVHFAKRLGTDLPSCRALLPSQEGFARGRLAASRTRVTSPVPRRRHRNGESMAFGKTLDQNKALEKTMKLMIMAWIAAFAVVFGGGQAWADPCEAPPPGREGAHFSGTVRYIGDGDSLCVGTSNNPTSWIEVRLADFDAPELNRPGGPEARTALQRIAMGREARCTARRGRSGRVIVYDRVIATCRIDGRSVGDLMREAGVAEGGR